MLLDIILIIKVFPRLVCLTFFFLFFFFHNIFTILLLFSFHFILLFTIVGTNELSTASWDEPYGRAVVGGTTLLTTPSAIVKGLQRHSAYVMRVIAVRCRRIVLPDEKTCLDQTLESIPSSTSLPFWTLDPDAEVARLTSRNAYLEKEITRIPKLEEEIAAIEEERTAEVTALGEDLAQTQAALATAISEGTIARNDATTNAATVAERTTELAERTAQLAALQDAFDAKTLGLTQAMADIDRLKIALLNTESERDEAKKNTVAAYTKVQELEANLTEVSAIRTDLARKVDAQSRQIGEQGEEKSVFVEKLTGDLAKVMDELARVERDLYKAQDYIAYVSVKR